MSAIFFIFFIILYFVILPVEIFLVCKTGVIKKKILIPIICSICLVAIVVLIASDFYFISYLIALINTAILITVLAKQKKRDATNTSTELFNDMEGKGQQ